MQPPTKLRLFADRDELSRFIVEVTKAQRLMMAACMAGALAISPGPQRVAFCRMARALFDEQCDAANLNATEPAELALIDADIDALMPRLRTLSAADLVVDLETLERLMQAEEPVD